MCTLRKKDPRRAPFRMASRHLSAIQTKTLLSPLAMVAFVGTIGSATEYKVWLGPPSPPSIETWTPMTSVNDEYVMHYRVEEMDDAIIWHALNYPGECIEIDLGYGWHTYYPTLVGIKEDWFLYEAHRRSFYALIDSDLALSVDNLENADKDMLRFVVRFQSETARPFRLEIPVAVVTAKNALTPEELEDSLINVPSELIYSLPHTKLHAILRDKTLTFDWLGLLLEQGIFQSRYPFPIEYGSSTMETYVTRYLLIEREAMAMISEAV